MSDNVIKFPGVGAQKLSDREEGISALDLDFKLLMNVTEQGDVTDEQLEAIARFVTDEFTFFMRQPEYVKRRKAFLETLLDVKLVDGDIPLPDDSCLPMPEPPPKPVYFCQCTAGPHLHEACLRKTLRKNAKCVFCINGHRSAITGITI